MRTDDGVRHAPEESEALGDFGDSTPRNSFSGGETDHLFLSYHGEQFYDLDALSGLADGGDGRTFCTLDYDRDGWTDFVVASASAPTFQLHRNRIGELHHAEAEGARMLAVRLVGGNRSAVPADGWAPRNGYGAMVEIDLGDEVLIREHRCGEGRAAQNSSILRVGLGDVAQVRSVTVRWPSGKTMSIDGVGAGSLVTAFENPQESPDSSGFALERYVLPPLERRTAEPAPAQVLAVTAPMDDTIPELRVFTAMSTHCTSCKKKMPQVELLGAYFGERVGLYGVSTDLEESQEILEAYSRDHQPAYRVLTAAPLEERQALRDHVRALYQDDLTPVSVVTDPTGVVLETFLGVPTVSDLRRILSSRK